MSNLKKMKWSGQYRGPLRKLNDELLNEVFERARKADVPEDLMVYAFWAKLTEHFTLTYPRKAGILPHELRAIREACFFVPPF